MKNNKIITINSASRLDVAGNPRTQILSSEHAGKQLIKIRDKTGG
jgi:hypothetical protein